MILHQLIPNGSLSTMISKLPLSYWNGPWVAGGAPIAILENREDDTTHDVDVFFKSATQYEEFCDACDGMNGYSMNKTNTPHGVIFYLDGAKINAISRKFYTTANEVIDDIDITICQVVTDSNTMYIREQSYADLETKTLRITTADLSKIFSRILKYSSYGFTMDDESRKLFIRTLKSNQNNTEWFYNYDS